MVEALVGRWKSEPPYPDEYIEIVKEVGNGNMLEMSLGASIIEYSLEGGNRLLSKCTPIATPPFELTVVTVIGGKTKDTMPGVGIMEVECGMEGSKVVSKATHNGQPFIKEIYIEGGKLMNAFKWGNHSCAVAMSKM